MLLLLFIDSDVVVDAADAAADDDADQRVVPQMYLYHCMIS
jgi:hypothetical protein